jgi:hypothetical protein
MTNTKLNHQSLLHSAFGIDLRSLALFRIAVACVILLDLVVRARDLTAHYSDGGVLPRSALVDTFAASPWHLSLHLMNGTTVVQALLFMLAAVCALLLLVGYRTQWMSIASWFLLISLHNRNEMVLHGGDITLRMLLFWGMFLPLGARFSLDGILASAQDVAPGRESGTSIEDAAGSSFPTTSTRKADPSQNQLFSIATLAALLQVCFIYWFSYVLKSGGAWKNGTAVYYAFSFDQLTTPLGQTLLAYPNVMRQLTFLTAGLEAAGPCLALLPFFNGRIRLAMVITFIGFHAVLGLCLTLGIFPLACIAGWLLFVPGSVWDSLSRRCPGIANRWEACMQRVRTLRSRVEGQTRGHAPAAQRAEEPGRRDRWDSARAWSAQGLAAFFLVYVFCWNLRTINFAEYSRLFPTNLNWIGDLTRVDQMWGMFAPYPSRDDGWYVIAARLADGTEVDLFRNRWPVTWDKPPRIAALYGNERRQKYLLNLWMASNSEHRRFYADYRRRQWNSAHPPSWHIKSLRIYFMREETLPDYRSAEPQKLLLARFVYEK